MAGRVVFVGLVAIVNEDNCVEVDCKAQYARR